VERVVSFLNDVEFYRGFRLSATCKLEVTPRLPCVKGAVTVRYNILGIAVSIRLKMCRTVPSFSAL
jgi:hypothetical protein